MNHTHSSISQTRHWRRWIPPATVAGAGGTALVIWFEEVIIFVTEFIGVILVPIMAGLIFLFNHLVFRSAMPRRNDPDHTEGKPPRP
jgi:hypothetical protein